MKKAFSIFLVFATFFIVSCGGLLDEEPRNTVRITMGNARSVSASGASDVNYYNIVIQNQTFSNVAPGTTVESAQLPVGMSVSISVEAIGNITASTSGGQSGGAVGTTTTTVVSNGRIAYYQTSERLPAEGLTLNVNMANYKTEYHKVTLEAVDFDRVPEEVYVADGSSYTLPNYGTYTPSIGANGGVPLKHTGWIWRIPGDDNPPVYSVGASVTITGDRQFELQYDTYATITISAKYDSWNGGEAGPNSVNATKYIAKGDSFLLEDYGTFEDGSNDENVYKHLNWTVNNQDYNFGQSVKIESDIEITPNFIRGIRLMVDVQNFYEQIGNDIYDVDMDSFKGTAYIRRDETDQITGVFVFKNHPFTFPTAKKKQYGDTDWHDVEEWQYSNNSYTDEYASPGQTIILNDDVNMYSNFSIIERTN